MVSLQDRLGARFVLVPRVAVEEEDGRRLDAALGQHTAECRDLVLVERRLDLAVGQHPLPDLEAQRTLDQRPVLSEEQVVGIGAVDAADLVDVAEAFGDEKRGLGARALQDGVDGDRGAVQEQAGGSVVASRLLHSGIDAVDQAFRRRQGLAEAQIAGAVIEDGDVGERAADIGGETKVRAVGSGRGTRFHSVGRDWRRYSRGRQAGSTSPRLPGRRAIWDGSLVAGLSVGWVTELGASLEAIPARRGQAWPCAGRREAGP